MTYLFVKWITAQIIHKRMLQGLSVHFLNYPQFSSWLLPMRYLKSSGNTLLYFKSFSSQMTYDDLECRFDVPCWKLSGIKCLTCVGLYIIKWLTLKVLLNVTTLTITLRRSNYSVSCFILNLAFLWSKETLLYEGFFFYSV